MTQARAIGFPATLGAVVLPPGAFRLVLAVAVVISHISRLDIGRLAVLLFFYLSGYWTSRIWTEKFGDGALRRFYAARYLRIAPLFLLASVAAGLALRKPLHLENFTLLGVGSSNNDPTGVSWSLDVELQFYLLLPLILWALSAFRNWMVLAAAAALAVLGWWLDSQFGMRTAAKYLPAFLFGVLTYTRTWRPTMLAANASLAAFAVMTAVTAFTPFLDKRSPDPFDEDIWDLLWMLPLLPYVARSLTIRSSRLDRHFGNLSFPLYLVHFPLIAAAATYFHESAVAKAGAALAAILLSIVVYVLVDRPIDRWRVRLTESEKPGR